MAKVVDTEKDFRKNKKEIIGKTKPKKLNVEGVVMIGEKDTISNAKILLGSFSNEDRHSVVARPKENAIGTVVLGIVDTPENRLTSFEKMEIINSGISKKGLEQLKAKTTLDYDKFSKMLSTTKATLINKKGNEKFNAALSEKILSVADIYSYGYEVFEDEGRFNNWMLRPNRALGGKAPYEIMDNQFGREEVRDVIGRIDYGVYS